MIERAAGDFLSRWSRLKRAGGETPPSPVAPLGPLPDVATLEFGDDFAQFLHHEVAESVKRLALKKLFHSPAFNVMDGLDIYIDDYSIPDPLSPEMLKDLAHAKGLIFDADPLPDAERSASEVAVAAIDAGGAATDTGAAGSAVTVSAELPHEHA